MPKEEPTVNDPKDKSTMKLKDVASKAWKEWAPKPAIVRMSEKTLKALEKLKTKEDSDLEDVIIRLINEHKK